MIWKTLLRLDDASTPPAKAGTPYPEAQDTASFKTGFSFRNEVHGEGTPPESNVNQSYEPARVCDQFQIAQAGAETCSAGVLAGECPHRPGARTRNPSQRAAVYRKELAPWLCVTLTSLFIIAANANAAVTTNGPLVWNTTNQTYTLKPGEISARFTFNVTNITKTDVLIDGVKPSCGCTTAALPSTPWRIPAQGTGQFDAVVDMRGRTGVITKDIAVLSSNAPELLWINVTVPLEATNGLSGAEMNRLWGQKLAEIDHQAVFKTTCVKCHLTPAFGKQGYALYQAACAICHEAAHRAAMVPDLHSLKTEIDPGYWKNWVTHGKPGTLMPGFAAAEGGPLEDAQIKSLVAYLRTAFPRPVKTPSGGDAKK